MSTQHTDVSVQGLVSRAYDIDRLLALYRAELAYLPAGERDAPDPVREEVAELDDLLTVIEDLWRAVARGTARLYGEMQTRVYETEVARELEHQDEKWHRYLAFAAAAGIRVPTLTN